MELIRTKDGYYIPRDYLYYGDTNEKRKPKHEEHCYADPPSYNYDKETGKWCLEFTSADIGGYDVQSFTFYFDSEEELLKFLRR